MSADHDRGDAQKFSLMSDARILEELDFGRIVISPFIRKNLGTASYDVTLGEWYFREQSPNPGLVLYSPWSEEDVRAVWGTPQKADIAGEYMSQFSLKLPGGIKQENRIILVRPGETILCHTEEYVGGREGITTMMKARSSVGRNFIEVCKCAGWGDVGYINRWTMEVTNNSRHYIIPLVVGRRIAQIAFFEVGMTQGVDYSNSGKYQTSSDLSSLKSSWTPDDMLPKMWKDREIIK